MPLQVHEMAPKKLDKSKRILFFSPNPFNFSYKFLSSYLNESPLNPLNLCKQVSSIKSGKIF